MDEFEKTAIRLTILNAAIVIAILVVGLVTFFTFMPDSWAVSYSQIPTEPIVGFTFWAPDIAFIQSDYCFSLKAFDDRGGYHEYANPSIGPLQYATVKAKIFPASGDGNIDEIEGKTSKKGYFAACDFVTTHQYDTHGLYNMTMTVNYGDSSLTQETQFWTVNRH